MKMPEIGETVFGFQHKQDRPGETMYLCLTQAHCAPNYEEGLREALEQLCDTDEIEISPGEFIEVVKTEDAQNMIIWEMKRIR